MNRMEQIIRRSGTWRPAESLFDTPWQPAPPIPTYQCRVCGGSFPLPRTKGQEPRGRCSSCATKARLRETV